MRRLSALLLTIVLAACGSQERPGTAGAGTSPTGTSPVGSQKPKVSTPDAGASASDDAGTSNKGCPPPPYTCTPEDAGTTEPPPKSGAGAPNGKRALRGPGVCATDQVTFATSSLRISNGRAIASTWRSVIGATGAGPFGIRLFNFNAASSAERVLHVQGATSTSPTSMEFTEPGVDYPVSFEGGKVIVPATARTFHVALSRAYDPAGDLEVSGLAMTATVDPGCGSLTDVLVTLYVPESQGNVTISAGGPTLAQQLGPPMGDVGGLGFAGWAVSLEALDIQAVDAP